MISALHIGFQLSVLSLDIKEKKKKQLRVHKNVQQWVSQLIYCNNFLFTLIVDGIIKLEQITEQSFCTIKLIPQQ